MNVQIEIYQDLMRIIIPIGATPNIIIENETKRPVNLSELPTQPKNVQPSISLKPYFTYNGKTTTANTKKALLIKLLRQFYYLDNTFYSRFNLLPTHGRNRRYLTRTIHQLNPDRKDLAENYHYEIHPGWYLNTNIGRERSRIVELACEIMGIKLGSELKISWGR